MAPFEKTITDEMKEAAIKTEKFQEKLESDLKRLHYNPFDLPSRRLKNGDAPTKIISKDNIEFEVNRAMLAARSPFFESMFINDTNEAKTGIVELKDLNAKTIRILLFYIYTGFLHREWCDCDVIEHIFPAAEKFQLMELFEHLIILFNE